MGQQSEVTRCYDTARVPLKLQIPECSAATFFSSSSCLAQPGDFLKIFNLRALSAASCEAEGLASSQTKEANASHLTFHLHGGTAFGRGIRVLPKSSPDVQKMTRSGRRPGLGG